MLRSVTAALWLSEGGKAQEGDVEWIQETAIAVFPTPDCLSRPEMSTVTTLRCHSSSQI